VADEADVKLDVRITDVRNKNDLLDYTDQLLTAFTVRITDKSNQQGGGPFDQPATVQDLPFSFPVPCSATPDTSIGSTCSVNTTADAVTGDASTASERKRAIWELGAIQLYDGGPDGSPSTPDNTLFARQGIFVP
jgi:hypothetical protein